MSKEKRRYDQIQCPDCKEWESIYDTLDGYCVLCVSKKLRQFTALQAEIDLLEWMIKTLDFQNAQTGLEQHDSPELAAAKVLLAKLRGE